MLAQSIQPCFKCWQPLYVLTGSSWLTATWLRQHFNVDEWHLINKNMQNSPRKARTVNTTVFLIWQPLYVLTQVGWQQLDSGSISVAKWERTTSEVTQLLKWNALLSSNAHREEVWHAWMQYERLWTNRHFRKVFVKLNQNAKRLHWTHWTVIITISLVFRLNACNLRYWFIFYCFSNPCSINGHHGCRTRKG